VKKLIDRAQQAREASYSPYSNFKVGAAVEMSSGKVYEGSNIENSSYGLTVCAERVAIFKAISSGESRIRKLAVSCQASHGTKSSLMPCGACLQVISEFSDSETMIHVVNVGTFSIEDLLPQAFKLPS